MAAPVCPVCQRLECSTPKHCKAELDRRRMPEEEREAQLALELEPDGPVDAPERQLSLWRPYVSAGVRF